MPLYLLLAAVVATPAAAMAAPDQNSADQEAVRPIATAQARVVLMSAVSLTGSRIDAERLGMSYYVSDKIERLDEERSVQTITYNLY